MKLLIAILTFTFTATAFAFPEIKPNMRLPMTLTQDFNYDGIIALSNCSGSLVRFETSQDSDKAMVLTNGHCYEDGFFEPNTFVTHEPSNRRITLMKPDASFGGRVFATEVMYGTMTGTDITLYKLSQTYAEIRTAYGANALTISSLHPALAQALEVISGYWERGYRCNIESFVHELQEENWHFKDSIRYSRPGCEVIGGTSGSPIVLGGSRTVIGINNTGNEDGERCTRNNPCEIDDKGNVFYQQGYSYGQETYLLYTCLNANRDIDLTTPGCALYH